MRLYIKINYLSGFIFGSLLLATPYIFSQSAPETGAFSEVKKIIGEKYMNSVNIDSITNKMVADFLNDPATINRILESLDPHSYYFDQAEYADFKSDITGSFRGIGVVFGINEDTVLISEIIPGGPSEKDGLQPGDKIIKIDDVPVVGKGITFDNIRPRLIGPAGTAVKVSILRYGVPALINYTIIRDEIKIKSVESAYMIDDQTGYIKFTIFSETTAQEIHDALQKLNGLGMKKLILDLRDNSGGLLEAAVKIADEFLAENTLIVYTSVHDSGRKDYLAKSGGLFEKGAMVVLVNQSTASSAEILSGALQDNKRAVFIGHRTFGKSLIQQMYTLSDSSTALKLTIGKYYTPSGKDIQRSYSNGLDAYMDIYDAILKNNGELPDSLKKKMVVDWGILPEITISDDTIAANRLFSDIFYRNYISDVSNAWYSKNVGRFAIYKDLNDFTLNYKREEVLYEKFKNYMVESENNLPPGAQRLNYSDTDLQNIHSRIEIGLKAGLAREKWGKDAFYTVFNSVDPDILAALNNLKGRK